MQLELQKVIRDGFLKYVYLTCSKGRYNGEFLIYYSNGIVQERLFYRDGTLIGKDIFYNSAGELEHISYHSMIHMGVYIDENQYKKELAMLRLGIIKAPEFSYLIKDYEIN